MDKVILLVDDDNAFRESVRDMLECEGYRVVDIREGKKVIKAIEDNDVGLVITDILMADVDGNEVAVKVSRAHPELKVIGMTGGGRIGTADQVKELCVGVYFTEILSKPFLAEDLFEAVERSAA